MEAPDADEVESYDSELSDLLPQNLGASKQYRFFPRSYLPARSGRCRQLLWRVPEPLECVHPSPSGKHIEHDPAARRHGRDLVDGLRQFTCHPLRNLFDAAHGSPSRQPAALSPQPYATSDGHRCGGRGAPRSGQASTGHPQKFRFTVSQLEASCVMVMTCRESVNGAKSNE